MKGPNVAKKALRSSYPESLAKTCNEKIHVPNSNIISAENKNLDKYLERKTPKEPTDKRYRCSPGFITGSTTSKLFFKMVTCGRDWCPDCGQKNSITHSRRIQKNVPRVTQILKESDSIQYIIVTIPKQVRPLFNNQEALNDFRTYWRRKLKREGYSKGIMRWHWAGEDGYIYKPHLNILVPGKFIPQSVLSRWRNELSLWFRVYCQLPNRPVSNIYSAYTKSEGKAKHWVSYVFRATQTFFNKWSADTIKGYRNTSIFGKWEKLEQTPEEIEAMALRGFYQDPQSGNLEKITWQMQYSTKRKCLTPKLARIEEIAIESCTLISRAYWIRDKILKPPPKSREKIRSISGKDFFNFVE